MLFLLFSVNILGSWWKTASKIWLCSSCILSYNSGCYLALGAGTTPQAFAQEIPRGTGFPTVVPKLATRRRHFSMPPPGNWGTLSPSHSWGPGRWCRERNHGGPRVESHYLFNITLHPSARTHTHSRSCQRALLKPSWEDAEVTGKEAARIGTPGDGRRGDRVTTQSPSSPECAPCVEGHRPGGVGMEGPWDPRIVVPCRGPGTARCKGGLLGTRLLPS